MRKIAIVALFLLASSVAIATSPRAFADTPYSFLVFECVPKAGLFSFRTAGNQNIEEFPANIGSEPRFEPVEALDGISVIDLELLGKSQIRKIHCDISPSHEITFELAKYREGGSGCGGAQPGGVYRIKFDNVVISDMGDDLTACMIGRSYFVDISVQTLKIGVFGGATSCVLTTEFDLSVRDYKTTVLCEGKELR